MRFVAFGLLLVLPLVTFAQEEKSADRPSLPAPVAPSGSAKASSATAGDVDVSIKTWEEIQAGDVQMLLQSNLDDPKHEKGAALRTALALPNPQVTVRKAYPPDPDAGGQPEPYLTIAFDAAEDKFGDPETEKLATEFVSDVLSQSYFSDAFLKNLPAEMKTDKWIKSDYVEVAVGPEVRGANPFLTPRGLSMPWRLLAQRLGFLSYTDSTISMAFTPAICQEMAVKAVKAGMYEDAIALADHGIRQSTVVDPAFLYLRAYSEILLGRGGAATKSIGDLKATQQFPYRLQERLSGPAAVYLWEAHKSLK